MSQKPSGLLILLFSLILLHTQSRRLIYVQEIFRHGARYPIRSMKNDKSDFVQTEKENGELTSQGKHMQYILGKAMHDKYWQQLFKGTEYINKYHPKQIYVKSTNVNRTIESAQSQIQGLLEKLPAAELPITQLSYSFPPFVNANNYQEQTGNQTTFPIFGGKNTYFHAVPIHTDKTNDVPEGSLYKYSSNPYDQGDFLAKYDYNNCPNQKFWGKENLASEDAMKIKNSQKVTDFLGALSRSVGKQVKFEHADFYIDDYECELYLGREYLDLFKNPDYQKTSDFIMLTTTLIGSFYTDIQLKTSNTQLLQNTIYRMKEAKAGNGPKLVLFSAHDTTVLSITSALKLVDIPCVMDRFFNGANNSDTCISEYPQFATNVIFQLWQQDNLSHSVKILYNGVERKIPICNYQYACSFADFQSWANDFYIDDPNDSCGIREQYTKLYIVIGVLSLFILIFVIIEMSKRFKKKIELKMQEMEEKKGYIEHFQEKDNHIQPKAQD